MICFYDKRKGYTAADPSSFVGFDAQPAGVIMVALAIAGMSELSTSDFRERCQKVLMVPHPKTKSVFTRSRLKDNLRKLVDLCDQIGDSGEIAWE